MQFLKKLEILFNSGDPVVREWFLVKNTYLPFILCFLYALMAQIGPILMRNRKPLELRKTMIVFNFCIVFVYVGGLAVAAYYFPQIPWDLFCRGGELIKGEPAYIVLLLPLATLLCSYSHVHTSFTSFHMRFLLKKAVICAFETALVTVAWIGYVVKYFEFFDTVFFILRKKENLITFLHVFHHTIVPLLGWMLFRTEKSGLQSIPAILNCIVHVIMYSYYGLAAMGPSVRKYLWWKKYLTQLQIIQFVLVTLFVFVAPPITGCPMVIVSYIIDITLAPFFFVLFYRFYRMTFHTKPKKIQ